MPVEKNVFIIMGVSGCGKSTLGIALAKFLEIPFFDGDDFHPPGNIQKMSKGVPLEDSDREPWLTRLNKVAAKHQGQGLSLIHISEPTRHICLSRMPSSA